MSAQVQPDMDVCHVLSEDADLAEAVPADRRERAVRECVADTSWLAPGHWRPSEVRRPRGEGVGLLVLEGLLVRRVGIEGRFGAEVLGEGDLLRPWHGEEDSPTLALTTGWRVLQATRIAMLDERFLRRVAPYPEVLARLGGRAVQRSRNLAVNMAIVHQARVDVRLQMLLWHLAGRWGRVRGDGVALPLRLTHDMLADLAAAQRPTVTSALSDLGRRGLVESVGGEWLLHGEPPGELLELGAVRVAGP